MEGQRHGDAVDKKSTAKSGKNLPFRSRLK
jgi:hypothetical protein